MSTYPKHRFLRYLSIGFVNILVFILMMALLEGCARFLFPQFKNSTVIRIDDKTKLIHGAYAHHQDFLEGTYTRVPHPGTSYQFSPGAEVIGVIGDSVTQGWGLSYEDIYWHQLQRLLDAAQTHPPAVVHFAHPGANLKDISRDTEKFLEFAQQSQLKPKLVIYQFSYNDVIPYTSADVVRYDRKLFANAWFVNTYKYIHSLVSRHLGESVLLRVLMYYGAELTRKRSGSCAERGVNALGQYSYTFGSKPFQEQSQLLWSEFEATLADLKETLDGHGARFAILVSPLLYTIDERGLHYSHGHLNLDFSCATINPIERLHAIAAKYDMDLVDPTDYVRKSFERRVREGNFKPYFPIGDDVHINDVASRYLAEFLLRYLLNGPPAPAPGTADVQAPAGPPSRVRERDSMN